MGVGAFAGAVVVGAGDGEAVAVGVEVRVGACVAAAVPVAATGVAMTVGGTVVGDAVAEVGLLCGSNAPPAAKVTMSTAITPKAIGRVGMWMRWMGRMAVTTPSTNVASPTSTRILPMASIATVPSSWLQRV